MRLLVCAGASGGGVYPALAVLQALDYKDTEVLWVGGEGGMEATLIDRAGIPFATVPAAGLHGVGLRQLPGNLWQLLRGYLAARQLVASFKPDALFFTGGFVSVPAGLAGRRIPTLVFVPDIEPGLALKLVSRFADRIAVSVAESLDFFRGKAVSVTGYPTRKELGHWSKDEARQHLGLDTQQPVLLVFGGSKGARSINQALVDILPQLLADMQVLHITGELNFAQAQEAQQGLRADLAANYQPLPYLHEMGAALAAADLVVSRAGASTLGEFPLFGLPALLVPYPYAWRYQRVNAEYLASRGAAKILLDEELGQRLLAEVQALMQDEQARAAMCQAMLDLAQPGASSKIADLLADMASHHEPSRRSAW